MTPHSSAQKGESGSTASVPNQLGTFGGVFTPSILTVLGVIMFMRAGFVVGQAGIAQALLILLLAEAITFLTALSISAVSTNTPVAGGGAYFLISRSLGPESGGAIGLALFLAQAISVPFYILGFTEAVVRSFPGTAPGFQWIAAATALALFVVAYIGATWATKTQYVIMSILGLSVVAFLGGALVNFRPALFSENWTAAYQGTDFNFWVLFAIYFPAVTGIMAGVNMSGDLKNPARSLPRGTLLAVGVGFVIYAAEMLICGGAQTRDQLVNASFETLCAQALLGAGFLVVAGVFAATLSSALGSFLGAPRVLQALARDEVLPYLSFFARGSRRSGEPRRALVLTLGMTLGIIGLAGNDPSGGAFNILASVVTMFFLYTYGMVNLAAFVESFGGNPSFRPRFRYYHWLTALAGAGGCVWAAFLIDPIAALGAAFVVVLLFLYIQRRAFSTRFGDARWGFYYSQLRNLLLRLSSVPVHPKNWRPTILVLSGNPETRADLVTYAIWIGSGRGVVTLAEILVGDLKNIANLRLAAKERLSRFLRERQFQAFPEVAVVPDFDEGLSVLLQSHSIGALKPNIVLLGWSSDPERSEPFVRHLRSAQVLGMSLAILKVRNRPGDRGPGRIDVWWRGRENGSLMVVLAYLLTLNWQWSDAEIRVLRLIHDEAGREPATQALEELVHAARIEATVQVLVSTRPFSEILRFHSQDAALVFLGFKLPEEGKEAEFQARYREMLEPLPTTLLVCSSGAVDLLA